MSNQASKLKKQGSLLQTVQIYLNFDDYKNEEIHSSDKNSLLSQLWLKFKGKVSLIDAYLKMKQFKKKYPLIAVYYQMKKTSYVHYFPQENISGQELDLIANNSVLSARVLLLYYHFVPKGNVLKNHPLLKAICSSNNQTLKKYQKLKQISSNNQEKFLMDVAFLQLSESNQLVNQPFLPNYEYYSSQKIIELQNYKKDYKYLERQHDYIQWMFPNHFASRVNSSAFPMGYLQVQLFKESPRLGLLLLKSALIFFDFLGLELKSNCTFIIIQNQRLNEALNIHGHNHLRLRRLLACLSITGFRKIAQQFIKFLKQITTSNYHYKRLNQTFKQQWLIYRDQDEAIKLCYHPQKSFPDEHQVFKKIFNKQNGNNLKITDSNNGQQDQIVQQQEIQINQKELQKPEKRRVEKNKIYSQIQQNDYSPKQNSKTGSSNLSNNCPHSSIMPKPFQFNKQKGKESETKTQHSGRDKINEQKGFDKMRSPLAKDTEQKKLQKQIEDYQQQITKLNQKIKKLEVENYDHKQTISNLTKKNQEQQKQMLSRQPNCTIDKHTNVLKDFEIVKSSIYNFVLENEKITDIFQLKDEFKTITLKDAIDKFLMKDLKEYKKCEKDFNKLISEQPTLKNYRIDQFINGTKLIRILMDESKKKNQEIMDIHKAYQQIYQVLISSLNSKQEIKLQQINRKGIDQSFLFKVKADTNKVIKTISKQQKNSFNNLYDQSKKKQNITEKLKKQHSQVNWQNNKKKLQQYKKTNGEQERKAAGQRTSNIQSSKIQTMLVEKKRETKREEASKPQFQNQAKSTSKYQNSFGNHLNSSNFHQGNTLCKPSPFKSNGRS